MACYLHKYLNNKIADMFYKHAGGLIMLRENAQIFINIFLTWEEG